MRLVFMGTPEFAVSSLEALLREGHRIEAAVTQPDRPRGRGRMLTFPAVKQAALEHSIPVLQPPKVRASEFVDLLREIAPDMIVVVAFGQILPPSILEIPPHGCVNVHGSLLPGYRGAAPIQHAIIRGEAETGVTTMLMDPGMDTGPMLLKAKTSIHPNDTAGTLSMRLAEMGAELLLETLAGLEAGEITPIPQNPAEATLAPSLTREFGQIDWSLSARQIHNLVRGCNPHPGAYTLWQGHILKIWETEPIAAGSPTLEPGTVVEVAGDSFLVQAGEDQLRLKTVQPESRKRITGGEMARGQNLQPGDRLG